MIIVSASLTIDRLYEFHMSCEVSLSPSRRRRQEPFLSEYPSIMIDELSGFVFIIWRFRFLLLVHQCKVYEDVFREIFPGFGS